MKKKQWIWTALFFLVLIGNVAYGSANIQRITWTGGWEFGYFGFLQLLVSGLLAKAWYGWLQRNKKG